MKVVVAAVQPNTLRGEAEAGNVPRALEAIEEAAGRGARLILFPEGYPGPYNGPADYSPLDPLSEQAKRFGVYVIASWVEAAPDVGEGVYRLALKLICPDGGLCGARGA